jgi:periplasmic protein TonB
MRRHAYFVNNNCVFYIRIGAFSLLFVGLIFFVLPALEHMLRDVQRLLVRPVELRPPVVRPLPPPPPQLEKEMKKVKVRDLAKPKLRTPTPKTPAPAKIKATLSLDMMNLPQGDFALNFDVEQSLADTDFVFQLEDVQQAPAVIKRVDPFYPFKAKERGIEGEVTVYFVVNQDGTVRPETVEVTDARPSGIFDDSAIRAVSQWFFEPGKRDGKPVPVLMTVTLVFNLT